MGLGTLKLADIGLAKRHVIATQNRGDLTGTRYGTIQYEAPEAVSLNAPRSRLYDIWSMCCITLEFIIWLLYGNDELDSFYRELRGATKQVCQYFMISESDSMQPQVHPVVLDWINHIDWLIRHAYRIRRLETLLILSVTSYWSLICLLTEETTLDGITGFL